MASPLFHYPGVTLLVCRLRHEGMDDASIERRLWDLVWASLRIGIPWREAMLRLYGENHPGGVAGRRVLAMALRN